MPGTTSTRNILCMKWGERYTADYVNRLHAMVRRNLSGSYRFVCLTDDAKGVDPAVECFPIPFVVEDGGGPERGWRKLATFEWPLYDLEGTALYLDLDIVVVGPLDALFDVTGPFRIAHDKRLSSRGISNSSVYRFELGAHRDILTTFQSDHATLVTQFRNEQAYLSAQLRAAGQLEEWPAQWCISFKYDCLPTWPLNYIKAAAYPEPARVVFFHGHPKPPEAAAGYAAFRRFTRPTPWIAQYWR
jgi:hypothetical protein